VGRCGRGLRVGGGNLSGSEAEEEEIRGEEGKGKGGGRGEGREGVRRGT